MLFAVGLGTILAMSMLIHVPLARAQSGDLPCMPPAYAPRQTIRLVDRIPESATSNTPNVFYSSTITVTINSDDRICLSFSPNGRGPLKVDDLLDLQITHADGSTEEWSYNFYDPATDGITTTTARDLSGLFATRENKVAVTLSDLKPPRYSAEPIWLVIWKDPSATPIVTPKLITTPTAVAVSTATATSRPLPGQVATWTPYPTYTPLPTYTPIRLLPWVNPSTTATPSTSSEDDNLLLAMILFLLVVLVIVVALALWWLGKLGSRFLAMLAFLIGDLLKWISKNWAGDIFLRARKIIAKHGESRTDEIISDLETAWSKSLDLWRGQTDKQREIIFEGAVKGNSLELRGLAGVLKVRWPDNPEWATDEIINLVQRGSQPELFKWLSEPGIPTSITGEEKKKNAQKIREACKKAYIAMTAEYNSADVPNNMSALIGLLRSLLK